MDSLNWIKNATPLLKDRFKHITCVNVQIYKLEGNSWRELTKDFVLLHMYYDREDKEAKLVAIDGIKARTCCMFSASEKRISPKKDTRPIPLFSLEDSPWREQIPQPEVDSAVQHVEKELQELSCTSDLFLAVPTLPLVSCLSRQTSVDAESSFRCINSTTSNSNLKPAIPVQYKTYQLWGTPPWSVSARPTSHQNSTTITSPCNSLLPH
uniref:Uncharacterized protein n=1 Tax=Setaria digitata TaxID=48799 RepID=A0A915PS95_9BILA